MDETKDQCLMCRSGTYSLEVAGWDEKLLTSSSAQNDSLCLPCVEGVACQEGKTEVLEGWWRNQTQMLMCHNDACDGRGHCNPVKCKKMASRCDQEGAGGKCKLRVIVHKCDSLSLCYCIIHVFF